MFEALKTCSKETQYFILLKKNISVFANLNAELIRSPIHAICDCN